MTLAHFKQTPWHTSHKKYKDSALSISPAPEYASSEVLLASLYRTIGFASINDGVIPQAGRDLEKRIQKLRDRRKPAPDGSTLGVETWNSMLHGVLESPKLPNQSSKRFLQITPVVPGAALFSGSARLSSNSWPAGSLIRRMVWLGSKDNESAMSLWEALFAALSVNEDDDVFARWLEQEISSWNDSASLWALSPIPEEDVAQLAEDDYQNILFLPARQFTKDLKAIIQAKNSITRRQWTSLLESVLRLASVSHVTWLCDVQARIWGGVSSAIFQGAGPDSEIAARMMIFPESPQYMTYGGKALQGLKDKVSGYLSARLGINSIFWLLDQAGIAYEGDISSSLGVAKLCQFLRDNRNILNNLGASDIVAEIRESEARALLCKKGIGVNLLEFSRHVLGQRQTAIQLLRGYDQGYILKKKGASPASPWIVSLGPVAVLALVHCSLAGMKGPRSVHRLGQHLANYGVVVDRHDIAKNDLGYQLRMLGLVLDSPDAESGMLLLPPFPASQVTRGNE